MSHNLLDKHLVFILISINKYRGFMSRHSLDSLAEITPSEKRLYYYMIAFVPTMSILIIILGILHIL